MLLFISLLTTMNLYSFCVGDHEVNKTLKNKIKNKTKQNKKQKQQQQQQKKKTSKI